MQINSITPSIVPLVSSSETHVYLNSDAASRNIEDPTPIEKPRAINESTTMESLPPLDSGYVPDTASLKSESGSGAIPVKLATIVYALNHSFDPQKQMIDLLV